MKPQRVSTVVSKLIELQIHWSPERSFGDRYDEAVRYLRRTQGTAPHLNDGPRLPDSPQSSTDSITPAHAARALRVATEIVNYTTTEDIAEISEAMYARYCADMPADSPPPDTRYLTPTSPRRPARHRKPDQSPDAAPAPENPA